MIAANRTLVLSAPTARPVAAAGGDSAVLRSIVIAGLIVMLILSPVQFVTLPLNLAPVELWNLALLPIAWLYLIGLRYPMRLPYMGPVWLILLGSLIGMLSAPFPTNSLVAIVKDVYLYIWFATIVAVLSTLTPREFRRVMLVWTAVLMLHGLLIVGQFVSSDIFDTVTQLTAPYGPLDRYRPSGLFENANSTALFQLMGFVPLLVSRLPRAVAWILGLFLLVSVLATGSLAATAGFAVAVVVGLGAMATIAGRFDKVIRLILTVSIPIVIIGGLVTVAFNTDRDFQKRLNYVLVNRASGSAEGRFNLWERGLEFLSAESIWGIGPDSYKDVDFIQKPLHNDLLAFIVERGITGTVGLTLLVAIGVARAIRLLRQETVQKGELGLIAIVFVAALGAATVHGQFHQIFHHRSVWLVLAVQEALLLRNITERQKISRPISVLEPTSRRRPIFISRPSIGQG